MIIQRITSDPFGKIKFFSVSIIFIFQVVAMCI